MKKDTFKRLKQLTKSCANLQDFLQAYMKTKEITDSPFVLENQFKVLEKEYKRLKKFLPVLEEITSWFERTKKELTLTKQTYIAKLGAILAETLPEIKISGQLPQLKVGILTLEFFPTKDTVKIWYGPQYELIESVNLLKTDLAAEIKAIYQRLEEGGKRDEALLAVLFRAYQLALKEIDMPLGTAEEIAKLLPYVLWGVQKDTFWQLPKRTHFYEYTRSQLSFDLFRTQIRIYQNYEMRLVIATREQTKNKLHFLWVPSSWQGEGYCFAAIAFKKIRTTLP
jgi:hypothetical protein